MITLEGTRQHVLCFFGIHAWPHTIGEEVRECQWDPWICEVCQRCGFHGFPRHNAWVGKNR